MPGARFAETEDWEQLLRAAAYVRSNPRFDSAERARKLETARIARRLLDAARRGEVSGEHLDELGASVTDPAWPYLPILPAHLGWFRAWARSDAPSLGRALTAFLAQEPAEERFAAFARTAEELQANGVMDANPVALLVIGSLFNFAVAPDEVPVIRPARFGELERRLGWDADAEAPLPERYSRHVAFARELHSALPATLVRDMPDVQDLIMLSAREAFWSAVPPSSEAMVQGRSRKSRSGTYLSVCSCLGYETPYLPEWIEFHRLVGVERFFLYNNGDREGQAEALAPYVEEGIVVLHDWPQFPPQDLAYEHCIEHYRDASRWIAFIDGDEFLFSPAGEPVPKILVDYEKWPAVGVNMVHFMTSGHRTKPPGLVIENYTTVTRHLRTIHSIVDPLRAVRGSATAHHFDYDDGLAVDENQWPITGYRTIASSVSRLRVNHYHTKSEEEYHVKCAERYYANFPVPTRRPPADLDELRREEATFGRPDRAITRYVPAVREALIEVGIEPGGPVSSRR